MALPELFANSPTPGSVVALTTLGSAQGSTSSLTFTMAAAAPAALQASGSGQFRAVIDSEIVIFDATAVSTTTWTALTRGAEGSTAATHASGASVFHYVTAGAIAAAFGPNVGGYQSGAYYVTNGSGTWTSTSVANGVAEVGFFDVSASTTFSGIGINVWTAGTVGALTRLGIYQTLNGFPTSLIVDAGTIDGTNNTAQVLTISVTLAPGRYALVQAAQGAPATPPALMTWNGSRVGANDMPWHLADLGSTTGSVLLSATGVTGALPGTFPTVTYAVVTHVPRIFLKAQ